MYLVMVNSQSQLKSVKRYLEIQHISENIICEDTDSFATELMLASYDVLVFDFYKDLAILSALRDFEDTMGSLKVFVKSIDAGKMYTCIAKDIYVMPEEQDIMALMWSSDALLIDNYIVANEQGRDVVNVELSPICDNASIRVSIDEFNDDKGMSLSIKVVNFKDGTQDVVKDNESEFVNSDLGICDVISPEPNKDIQKLLDKAYGEYADSESEISKTEEFEKGLEEASEVPVKQVSLDESKSRILLDSEIPVFVPDKLTPNVVVSGIVENRNAGHRLKRRVLNIAKTPKEFLVKQGYITNEQGNLLDNLYNSERIKGNPKKYEDVARDAGYINSEQYLVLVRDFLNINVILWDLLSNTEVIDTTYDRERSLKLGILELSLDKSERTFAIELGNENAESELRKHFEVYKAYYTLNEYIKRRLSM